MIALYYEVLGVYKPGLSKQSIMTPSIPNNIISGPSNNLVKFRFVLLMKVCIALMLCLTAAVNVTAHPGSGIVIDKEGNIYFTDTGKGVWKIDTKGNLIYIQAPGFHWMGIDSTGSFSESQKSFGGYFERITPLNQKPALILCSDFPIVVNTDGNMYYASTRPGSANIIRRSPAGKESIVASNTIFEHIAGITSGSDGSLYITESSNPNGNTIRKVAMDGNVSTIATFPGNRGANPPLETQPSYCRGIAIDPEAIIYVAATGSRSVLKITPGGKVATILQETGGWSPTGVAVFRGEVYILEWHDVPAEKMEDRGAWIPRVRKIDRNGKVITLATVSR